MQLLWAFITIEDGNEVRRIGFGAFPNTGQKLNVSFSTSYYFFLSSLDFLLDFLKTLAGTWSSGLVCWCQCCVWIDCFLATQIWIIVVRLVHEGGVWFHTSVLSWCAGILSHFWGFLCGRADRKTTPVTWSPLQTGCCRWCRYRKTDA